VQYIHSVCRDIDQSFPDAWLYSWSVEGKKKEDICIHVGSQKKLEEEQDWADHHLEITRFGQSGVLYDLDALLAYVYRFSVQLSIRCS